MFNKLLLAVILAAVLFGGYLLLTAAYPYTFGGEPFYPNVKNASQPDMAPPVEQYPSVEPERVLTPGGPSAPNAKVAPPPEELESPEVNAKDPYDNPNGSSFMQDNLRHPERSFSPGVQPTNTSLAVESGVASQYEQTTSQAIQMFSPETAQNGGMFLQGVSANDTLQESEYATF
jgi:hypothetical protein